MKAAKIHTVKTAQVSQNLSQSRWSILSYVLAPLGLMAAALCIYVPGLRYGFRFDDLVNIVKNYQLRSKTFGSLFFTKTRWLSQWINALCYTQAIDPTVYRIINLMLHATTGLLIFFVLLRVLQNAKNSTIADHAFFIAFFTSGLFLTHPVQTQTVSYIVQGQLEGLASFFIMLMLYLFMLLSQAPTAVSGMLYALTLLTVALLSTGSKEIAIMGPVLLLLFDWFFVAQGSWSALKKRLLIHGILLVLVTSVFLFFIQRGYPGMLSGLLTLQGHADNNIGNLLTAKPGESITLYAYLISQFKVILHYLGIFFWPFGLSVDYDWKLTESFFSLDCLLPLVCLIAIVTFIYSRLRKERTDLLAFGLLWFFVCILPRASLIPTSELIADYKTYLGSFGVFIFLSYVVLLGLGSLFVDTKKRTVALHAVILATLVLSSFGALQRNYVWSSDDIFWLDVIKKAPNRARGYNNYGVALQQKESLSQAKLYFEKALALDPYYPDAYNNLAVCLSLLGEIDKAIETAKKSLALAPTKPEEYNNLGTFYLQKGDYDQAQDYFYKAIALRAHYGKALCNLGRVKTAQGKYDEAYTFFKKCCTQADFDNEMGFNCLGNICVKLKRYDEAIQAFSKAISLNKKSVQNIFCLANTHILKNEHDKAIPLYNQLIALEPAEPRFWFNLGELHFLTKDFNQALACYMRVREHADILVQLPLRIAACYERLGDMSTAKKMVESFIAQNPPEPLMKQAQDALRLFNGKT